MGVLAVLVSVAGCGSSPASPDSVIRHLYENTVSSGIVEALSVIHLHDVTVTGAPPGSISLIASPNETVAADGAVNLTTNDGSLTLSTPNLGNVEIDVYRGSFYMDFPPLLIPPSLRSLPWLYVDASTIANLKSPSLVAFFELLNSIDPAYSLSFLKGYVGDAKALGHSMVHGIPCTRYSYTIDLNKAASSLQGLPRQVVSDAIALLNIHREPLISCIDSGGKVRSTSFSLTLNNLAFPVPGQPFSSERISGSVSIVNQIWNYRGGNFTTKPPARYLDISSILQSLT